MNKIILIISVSLAVILLNSCTHKKADSTTNEPAVNDSIIKNCETAAAVLADDSEEVKLNGKIAVNESKTARVYALVSGKIETLKAELGDYVQKGQVLAVLKSTEVAGTANDVAMAEANVEMARKSLQTTKDLYEGKLATEQDYINAKITYNKALSELNRSKQVSSITGGANARFTVVAPISGYVIEKNITNNSEVRSDNNTNLFTISDLSEVWVAANVYEADMMNIHLGDAVIVNTLANPDKNYPGKIDKIYNVLDPATRTMQVRISMRNDNRELKPEMFATVKVNIHPAGKILTIPVQALVMDNSKYYVIVKENNKLLVKQITLIKRNEYKAYISGLAAGDKVVTSSQVFIYQALTSN